MPKVVASQQRIGDIAVDLRILSVNLGHYMRTLFFDIMQAEDVLFICILSSKPETRTTSRKWREAAMQVSKILLSL